MQPAPKKKAPGSSAQYLYTILGTRRVRGHSGWMRCCPRSSSAFVCWCVGRTAPAVLCASMVPLHSWGLARSQVAAGAVESYHCQLFMTVIHYNDANETQHPRHIQQDPSVDITGVTINGTATAAKSRYPPGFFQTISLRALSAPTSL